jgi:hypothetical protein
MAGEKRTFIIVSGELKEPVMQGCNGLGFYSQFFHGFFNTPEILWIGDIMVFMVSFNCFIMKQRNGTDLSRNLGNLIRAKSNFSPRGLISAYEERQMLCTRCSTRSYRGPAGVDTFVR